MENRDNVVTLKGTGMRTLREWRMVRLVSLKDLAAASGVTKKTLIDIEHGRRQPHYETMRKLCMALNVEPAEVTEFAAALDERSKNAA